MNNLRLLSNTEITFDSNGMTYTVPNDLDNRHFREIYENQYDVLKLDGVTMSPIVINPDGTLS